MFRKCSKIHNVCMLAIMVVFMIFFLQIEVMKGNVDSRVKSFQQDIDKFAARWHQLKPGDEALEGDREKTKQAIQIIKEKRQEFQEMEENRKRLVYVCFSPFVDTYGN